MALDLTELTLTFRVLGHISYIPGLDGSVFTVLLDQDKGVKTLSGSTVDPHWFKCSSGSRITAQYGFGFSSGSRDFKTKNGKIILSKKIITSYFLKKRIAIHSSLGHYTTLKRSLQPSKENIQHFKT